MLLQNQIYYTTVENNNQIVSLLSMAMLNSPYHLPFFR